jgi:multiple sugar transport system substrate-binding protein
MIKKTIYISIILVLFTTLGLGCKGSSQEELAKVKPIKLTYWTIYNDVSELRRMADEYKLLHPHISIDIKKVRFSEFDKLFVNALADDVEPDIISAHVSSLRKYKNRLSEMPSVVSVSDLRTTGKYFKETEVVTQNNAMPTRNTLKRDFVTTVAEDVVIGGSIYGLPLALDTLAIYYNKDLLDQSGIPVSPTTWDEFHDVVKRTTRFNSNGDIVQSGVPLGTGNIDNMFDILSLFMMQSKVQMERGGAVTFANGLDKATYNHNALKALRFYTDFAQPTTQVYSWNDKIGNALDAFVTGKAVFYFGFAYDKSRIKARAPQMNLEIIPVPQLYKTTPVNVADYWVETVVKKSKNQIIAWDFIRFMATPDNIAKYTAKTGQPTPLRAQISAQAEDPEMSAFASQILFSKNWYKGNNKEVAIDAFDTMVTEYLKPYPDPAEALERDANLIIRAAQIIQQTI